MRPTKKDLTNAETAVVPMSCQRIMESIDPVDSVWIGPEQAAELSEDEEKAYNSALQIMCHLAIQAPLKHKSGHPGGPLSAFTFSYFINARRDPSVDQPMRMSAGHLSILGYALEYLFGREGNDERLASPQAIIDTFRTPSGLPGHIEAGIGTIPFGTGPLGKGLSNALGVAFGLKLQNKKGVVDILVADGDAQEGQVMEAIRLAPMLKVDNLVMHGDFNDIQLSGLPTKTFAPDLASMVREAGWHVIEVQNGNDTAQVKAAQDKADELLGNDRPVFICYYTTMGNGIELMEQGSNSGEKNFHGAPLSEEEAEEATAKLVPLEEAVDLYSSSRDEQKKRFASAPPVETDILLDWNLQSSTYARAITEEKGGARKDFGAVHIKNLMEADKRIIVLHADLAGSGGFGVIEKAFPERIFNVGVAEANMYMMAAGMRQTGLLPVTYTFAAFGTNEARANARLIDINCGHTRCGVVHDCTHAGLSVGEDGETHQERHYLNVPFDHHQIWMSADCNQAAAMAERSMEIIAEGHQNVYTFFPRSSHPQIKTPDGDIVYGDSYKFDGKADLVRGAGDTSDQLTILATGIPVHSAIEAADSLLGQEQSIRIRVLNVACIRPLDASAVIQAALETQHLIVVEDHSSETGLASQVADIIADFALPCSLRRLGVNQYFPSAPADNLFLMAGIDTESILDAVEDEVRAEVCGGEDAFVSAMQEIIHNAKHSRFEASTTDFLQKVQSGTYMSDLRQLWAERECPKEKLPSNEQLLKKILEK